MTLYEILSTYDGSLDDGVEVFYDFIQANFGKDTFSGKIGDIPYKLLDEKISTWWYEEGTYFFELVESPV